MQKARIKGISRLTEGDLSDHIVEADSIELLPDEPEKREVRDGDVFIAPSGCIEIGYLVSNSRWNGKGLRDCAGEHLFNLLDFVTQSQKAKGGKTEVIMSRSDNDRMIAYIDNAGDMIIRQGDDENSYTTYLTKSDAFRFFAQGLALCEGKKE